MYVPVSMGFVPARAAHRSWRHRVHDVVMPDLIYNEILLLVLIQLDLLPKRFNHY